MSELRAGWHDARRTPGARLLQGRRYGGPSYTLGYAAWAITHPHNYTEARTIMKTAQITQQIVHEHVPSGFGCATPQQVEAFEATGSVHGASKVAFVDGGTYYDGTPRPADLVIRMRPPRSWDDIRSELPKREYGAHRLLTRAQRDVACDWYIREYNRGWKMAQRRDWPPGTSHAFDDGYLDRAAGRIKWHLTYCPDHDECGEG